MRADNNIKVRARLTCDGGKLSALARGRDQNLYVVRFWIITMILVLFGLSTLKLR